VGAGPVVGPGLVELEVEPVVVDGLIVVPVGEVTVPTPVGPVSVPDPEPEEPVEPEPAEPAPELEPAEPESLGLDPVDVELEPAEPEPSVLPVGAGLVGAVGVPDVLPVP
jgi:hypothetical protein